MENINRYISWNKNLSLEPFITVEDVKAFLLQHGYEWDMQFCKTEYNMKDRMYEVSEKFKAEIDSKRFAIIELYDINKKVKKLHFLRFSNTDFSLLSIFYLDDPDFQRERISLCIPWQKYLLNKYGEEYASQLIECVRDRRVEVKLTLNEYSAVLEDWQTGKASKKKGSPAREYCEWITELSTEQLAEFDEYEKYVTSFIEEK